MINLTESDDLARLLELFIKELEKEPKLAEANHGKINQAKRAINTYEDRIRVLEKEICGLEEELRQANAALNSGIKQ